MPGADWCFEEEVKVPRDVRSSSGKVVRRDKKAVLRVQQCQSAEFESPFNFLSSGATSKMNPKKSSASLFRVVTIGDSSVGKTSIINNLTHSGFDINEPSTIGANFVLYVQEVDGQRIELQIWDTAGQERFRSLGPIYYRNSAAALVVFDVTHSESFENLTSWIDAFTEIAGAKALIAIIGNKSDLQQEIKVDPERARAWSQDRGYLYFSTSARTGDGIDEALREVAAHLCDTRRMEPVDPKAEAPAVSAEERSGCGC